MKKLIIDMLTGKDGSTYDVVRVGGVMTLLTFLALAAYAVVAKGQTWDPQAFGIGAGAVIAAVGAACGLKAKTEPGS